MSAGNVNYSSLFTPEDSAQELLLNKCLLNE